jgi:ABC-type dipeptide/oligopeptide/nickel transport system permease component
MPKTGVSPCFKVKVTEIIVNGFIASLKMAVIALLIATPVAALTGMVELTVGAVVSDGVLGMRVIQEQADTKAITIMIDIAN